MTDEELAEKYIDEHSPCFKEYPKANRGALKQAFLAGLKAGKPKWHKIADGDYPPCEKGNSNYTINVLTDKGDIAYYSYNYDCWIAEPSSVEIDPPIDWCEIPTPELAQEKTEKEYRPFASLDELTAEFKKRFQTKTPSYALPLIWVKQKDKDESYLITGFVKSEQSGQLVKIGNAYYGLGVLFDHYEFLDGSPCGVEK